MPFHVIQVNENAVIFRSERLFDICCNHDARTPRRRDLATPGPPRYLKAQSLAIAVGMEVALRLDPIPPEVRHMDRYADLGVPVSAGEGPEEGALVDLGPGLRYGRARWRAA